MVFRGKTSDYNYSLEGSYKRRSSKNKWREETNLKKSLHRRIAAYVNHVRAVHVVDCVRGKVFRQRPLANGFSYIDEEWNAQIFQPKTLTSFSFFNTGNSGQKAKTHP